MPDTALSASSEDGLISFTSQHFHSLTTDQDLTLHPEDKGLHTELVWKTFSPRPDNRSFGRIRSLVYFDYDNRAETILAVVNVKRILLRFPHWCPLLIFAILPTVRLLKARRQYRRRKLNLCLSCGYDLRSGHTQCPECGTPVSPVPA